MQRCEIIGVRVALIVLVVFVALYVAVTAMGAQRHSTERTPSINDRPSSLSLNWSLVPGFLKVQPKDVVIFGTIAGPRAVAIAPSGTAAFRIRASTQQYRVMQLRLGPGFPVALAYPPLGGVAPSQTPEPLSPQKPRQTLVLPQSGGDVSLTCFGPGSCVVSY